MWPGHKDQKLLSCLSPLFPSFFSKVKAFHSRNLRTVCGSVLVTPFLKQIWKISDAKHLLELKSYSHDATLWMVFKTVVIHCNCLLVIFYILTMFHTQSVRLGSSFWASTDLISIKLPLHLSSITSLVLLFIIRKFLTVISKEAIKMSLAVLTSNAIREAIVWQLCC